LADTSGNAYDASFLSEIGLARIVEMHGIENITGSSHADTITAIRATILSRPEVAPTPSFTQEVSIPSREMAAPTP